MVALLLTCVAVLGPRPIGAAADADPASDFLLAQPVFYPYVPPTSAALQHGLQESLRRLEVSGVDLKVAIVGSPGDLGAVSNLFGRPQEYADFLDREISFNTRQALLVVMPAGFGAVNAGPPGALAGLGVDRAHGSDGLARSALTAVGRVARGLGHPIVVPAIAATGPRSHSTGTGWVAFAVPALAVLAVALLSSVARRRRGP